MNNLFRGLIAGIGAWKLGGGCLGTIVVFIIIWLVLGQCSWLCCCNQPPCLPEGISTILLMHLLNIIYILNYLPSWIGQFFNLIYSWYWIICQIRSISFPIINICFCSIYLSLYWTLIRSACSVYVTNKI